MSKQHPAVIACFRRCLERWISGKVSSDGDVLITDDDVRELLEDMKSEDLELLSLM